MKMNEVTFTSSVILSWMLNANFNVIVLAMPRSKNYLNSAIEEAGTGEVMNIADANINSEPSCEELKAMWRFSKRQSRAAEVTNEIPTYKDPFSYNIWEPYYARSRTIGGFGNRYKRELELSPEDIVTLLSLWEEDRYRQPAGYRTNWPRHQPDIDLDNDRNENDIEDTDESWLESPVYPGIRNPTHMSQYPVHSTPYSSGYFDTKQYEPQQQIFTAAKRQWGGFSDKKRKRFMVSRKRSDPTRELRYLNGPAQGHDDMYSLSQLLGPNSQRDLTLPVYHRMVL